MNSIVRCPECRTSYQLEPDQQNMAQGWLQCGQCQHVFDSTGLVLPWPGAKTSAPDTEPLEPLSVLDDPIPQSMPALSMPSHQKGRRWQKAFSLSLLVLLMSGLILQGLWMERDKLMETNPSMARAWHALCQTMGCEPVSMKIRDSVVIDHSSLLPQGDGFSLSWTVHNAAHYAVQMPALELSLMNADDKVLARRVFLAAQLGAPAALSPGENWNGQMTVFLETGLTSSGYRLVHFYP